MLQAFDVVYEDLWELFKYYAFNTFLEKREGLVVVKDADLAQPLLSKFFYSWFTQFGSGIGLVDLLLRLFYDVNRSGLGTYTIPVIPVETFRFFLQFRLRYEDFDAGEMAARFVELLAALESQTCGTDETWDALIQVLEETVPDVGIADALKAVALERRRKKAEEEEADLDEAIEEEGRRIALEELQAIQAQQAAAERSAAQLKKEAEERRKDLGLGGGYSKREQEEARGLMQTLRMLKAREAAVRAKLAALN
jgi:hypothetical protein